MLPQESESTPRIAWEELRAEFFAGFEQGQHISIIGPTGSGKSTLAKDLLDSIYAAGGSILFLANKSRDPLLSQLQKEGWARIKKWPPDYHQLHQDPGNMQIHARILLWPEYGKASEAKKNARVFVQGLDSVLKAGKWFVYIDELRYAVEQLGLRHLLDEIWNDARSSGTTLIAGAQGTSWTPRGHRDQETWLFLFKPRGREELKEYADIAGDRDIAGEIASLGRHEFLMIHTPNGIRAISKVS